MWVAQSALRMVAWMDARMVDYLVVPKALMWVVSWALKRADPTVGWTDGMWVARKVVLWVAQTVATRDGY